MSDTLAYDQNSARTIDKNGRLHVELTPLTKANICEYFGREIPDAKALGLDPDRKYKLFRDPEELKKAVSTFNNIPLVWRHPTQEEGALTPDNPLEHLVVGSTGTDAIFNEPFLENSLVIWQRAAMDGVMSERKKQLSAGYAYKAVMEPGSYLGAAFDGRMANIAANHEALVIEGRAGADVMVTDGMPLELQGELNMPTIATVSRKALLAHGALSAVLKPLLAADQALDMKAILLGTTAANWSQAKPIIIRRVEDATRGKLAQDAKLDGVKLALDALDNEAEDEREDEDDDEKKMKAKDARRAKDEGISEEEAKEKREAEDAKTARDTRRAMDESEETEEEREERLEARDKKARDKAAKDKRAKDAKGKDRKTLDVKLGRAATDKEFEEWAKEEEEEPEHRGEDGRRARDRRARDAEPRPVTKAAMDAAIERSVVEARTQWTKDQADLRQAEIDVQPLVGQLLGQDNAVAVYHVGLKSVGVPIPPDASIAVLKAMTDLAKQARARTTAPMALDGATLKTFEQRHPDVARIRIL